MCGWFLFFFGLQLNCIDIACGCELCLRVIIYIQSIYIIEFSVICTPKPLIILEFLGQTFPHKYLVPSLEVRDDDLR